MSNVRLYKNSKRTSLYMNGDVLEKLSKMAEERGVSFSQMVNKILEEHLRKDTKKGG